MKSPITCKIEKIDKHPNAVKLKICTVYDGKQHHQVVCGATNAFEGMITILAPVDSTTPNGLQIKSSDLRGVISNGMLCSAKDLGINQEKGIVDLEPATPLGVTWDTVNKITLSSTPWYRYKLIDTHYENENNLIIRKSLDNKQGKLISLTYWDGNQYLYRHFN